MPSFKSLQTFSERHLPFKFIKHYIYPFFVRGRRRRYDARAYFKSYYRANLRREFSDGITVSPDYNPLFTRFHYNAVENSIITGLAPERGAGRLPAAPDLLDIGPGAGHWIDFYRRVFGAAAVTGIEISPPCAEELRRKYADHPEVAIEEDDISRPGFDLGRRFDLINAVGVIFHIVDDAAWERAIAQMAAHLKDTGLIVIGGHFGWLTRDVQFHAGDKFASFEEKPADAAEGEVRVNKRIRSLLKWRAAAAGAGLRPLRVVRTAQKRGIRTPENHILILGRDTVAAPAKDSTPP